jgi:hypothetical protein
VCVLPRLDKLHTMVISILDHLQRLNFHFKKSHERLHNYNAIKLSVAAYHDLTPMKVLCKEVSERNGNEKQEMSQLIL